jgi:pimeloyl-ACP methyl ester carboxylesterase
MIHACSEVITCAGLLWMPRYNVKLDRHVARVRIPTLVAADDDSLLPEWHPQRRAELIPGPRLTTVDGDRAEPSAHLLILQQPRRLAQTIAGRAGSV